MEISIREAKIEDYEDICSLNAFDLGYDYPKEKTIQRLAKILQNSNAKIYIAEIDRQIIGYIHATDYDCTYMDSLKNILAIAVAGSHRGKGVGRALLSAVEEWAKNTGSAGVRLVSGMDREKAHQFYLSCGYIHRKSAKNFVKIFTDTI